MRSAFKRAALMVSVQTLRDNNTHFILRFLGKLRNLLLGKGKRPEVASQNNTGTYILRDKTSLGRYKLQLTAVLLRARDASGKKCV